MYSISGSVQANSLKRRHLIKILSKCSPEAIAASLTYDLLPSQPSRLFFDVSTDASHTAWVV